MTCHSVHSKFGATVLVECDVVHVAQLDPRLAQAIGDRMCGKAGPMLDAAKALLLGRRDQLAVTDGCGE